MMDGTDRHCRYFHRLLSKHARLYTEMITADAIVHGNQEYLLGFDATEHPVALQLGGSEPDKLREAARIGEDFGYDEINLNVGCPSDRVQSGAFGACLMKEPALVGECVSAMNEAVNIPVTVKCRIGVDDQEPRDSLFSFVDTVHAAGCTIFTVHARKAWLKGLSPKENRTVPPIDYEIVAELKNAHPDLTIIINGEVTSLDQSQTHLARFDGVMLGRTAYSEPYILSGVDQRFFGEVGEPPSRENIVEEMSDYLKRNVGGRIRAHAITRHMIGLYHGAPRARTWRRFLSDNVRDGGDDILDRALAEMRVAQEEYAAQA